MKPAPTSGDVAALRSAAEIGGLVDHLFRREAGRLISILTRRFGSEYLHLAEDVVQDALGKAMRTWPFSGVPKNPSAWLLQTAKNAALDQTRRRSRWKGKQGELAPLVEEGLRAAFLVPAPLFEDEVRDSQLRMMFVCCHPALPSEAQVALILKALCGFGEREIAAAFLATEAAVTKRLVRARQLLRAEGVGVELPAPSERAQRLAAVLQALYLLFNEGYKAYQGDSLLRADFCAEAVRRASLLAADPVGDCPETHALLALMLLNSARLPGRVDGGGGLLLLGEQDRRQWDREMIRLGLRSLATSGAGSRATRYHLEAGIAACHCLSPKLAATDWRRILGLYDRLWELDRSPIVALNRAVALAQVQGPQAGLRALARVGGRGALENYYLLHAVRGQLWLGAGHARRAATSFRRACALATLPAERALLKKKLVQAVVAQDQTANSRRAPPLEHSTPELGQVGRVRAARPSRAGNS